MIMDALTTIGSGTSTALTTATAGGTVYSDVLDLSTVRDVAAADMPISVIFTTLPTSATGGATINIALQTSSDNSTYVTLEETSAQPIANYTSTAPYAFRGTVPAGCLRYLRLAYTPSAVLTAGAVIAQVGAEWPLRKSYPRNYVA